MTEICQYSGECQAFREGLEGPLYCELVDDTEALRDGLSGPGGTHPQFLNDAEGIVQTIESDRFICAQPKEVKNRIGQLKRLIKSLQK